MGELNNRLPELRCALVELRHQYHSLDVDLLDLDDGPGDATSKAPAVLDATQATLGDVTATLLLAEVGLDLVQRYSTSSVATACSGGSV